jgi:hypothetical protein
MVASPCYAYNFMSPIDIILPGAKEKQRRRKQFNIELAMKRKKDQIEKYELVKKKITEEFGNFDHEDLMVALRKLKIAAELHTNPRDQNQGSGILRSLEEAFLEPRAFLAIARKHLPSLELSSTELGALSKLLCPT